MKMRVADYIAEFFADNGINDCFMITGGGAMHLNDAIGHNDRIRCVFDHHEQASAMAAEGYARVSGSPALVCVTSGPGGTNAITGVMGAWVDSIPMVVISGQIKRETSIHSCPDLHLRQLGDQEFDITGSVANMTKYAVFVDDPGDIAYHLEKALYLATHGRKGPVWLDLPLDVQGAQVDTDRLRHLGDSELLQCFDNNEVDMAANLMEREKLSKVELRDYAQDVLQRIREAHAPVLLVGTGVHLAGAESLLLDVIDRLQIPVLTAWNANDLIAYDHPYYAGMPGTVGTRAGNFALQNADLMISIGCRMNIRMTGYTHHDFAKNAYKIAVDIDENELRKPTVRVDMPVCADAAEFLRAMQDLLDSDPSDEGCCGFDTGEHGRWLRWCRHLLDKYPVVLPEYHAPDDGHDGRGAPEPEHINPYVFIDELFGRLEHDAHIVCGNGSACVVTFQAAKIKQGQRMFTNSGSASMGYAVPAAIGAAIALRSKAHEGIDSRSKDSHDDTCGDPPVICIDGDGSIMMNLQELATIAHNKLNIKIFVLNNNGYHSMRQTQRNLFEPPFVGIDPESGVSFPDLSGIADAFGLSYYRISGEAECISSLPDILAANGPYICEVLIDPAQDFAPKISSRVLSNGRIVSPTLSDMSPFLEQEEYERT